MFKKQEARVAQTEGGRQIVAGGEIKVVKKDKGTLIGSCTPLLALWLLLLVKCRAHQGLEQRSDML